MTQRSVAGRLLETMAGAGAGTVFGLPGVHNLAFWRQSPGDGLPRIVNVRHEQTTVYAADGFARASGLPGFALVTTGPGAANAVGAFGEAAMSKSPVVLVASEVPRRLVDAGLRGVLHQSTDQVGLFRPLAKATFTPRDASQAVASLAEAVTTAMAAPQGPVYFDVPADVLGEPGPVPAEATGPGGDDAGRDATTSGSTGDTGPLEAAAELIDAAATVAIWAGGGVVQAGAAAALGRLADHLQAPVFTTFASRGVLPPDHPSTVTVPPHEPETAALLAAADLLLVLGSDLDGMNTKNLSLPFPPTIVNVNADPQRLTVPGREVHRVLGDVGWAIEGLRQRTAAREAGLAGRVRAVCEGAWARLRADERTAPACDLVAAVERVARGRAVLVNDMAVPGYWLAGYYVPDRPRSMQYPMGWGTLGYGLPASVGAAFATPGPVLVVCGDGGIMFALGELATLAQQELPVTVLVVDDAGYGMLRFDQREQPASRGADLVVPDFVRLAESFGMEATAVEGVGDGLAAALDDALASGRPRLVHCRAALYPPRTTSPRWSEP
ncbi:MAG: thiamine pyrophosphate-binding protein [Acidimicrobiales bacterium]